MVEADHAEAESGERLMADHRDEEGVSLASMEPDRGNPSVGRSRATAFI
jgi:hypothetical protein